MKPIFILFIFLLLFPAPGTGTVNVPERLTVPLNLSEAENQWRFMTGDNMKYRLYNYDDRHFETVQGIPFNWKKDSSLPDRGNIFGWFRVQLKFPDTLPAYPLILRIGPISDADETYFNGKLIGKTGSIATGYTSSKPQGYDKIRLYPIPPGSIKTGKVNVIAIRVRSYFPQSGGFSDSISRVYLGHEKDILIEFFLENLIPVLIVAVILTVAAYFILLFIRRMDNGENLWFGITSLLFAVYFFLRTQIKHLLITDYLMMKRIEYIVLFLMLVSFMNFIYLYYLEGKMFRGGMREKIIYALNIFTFISAGIPVFSNSIIIWDWYNLNIVQPSWILFVVIILWILVEHALKRNADAFYMLGGLSLALICMLNDILVNRSVLPWGRVGHFGFLIFILSFAAILANRFVRLHNEVELLNRNLEKKVRDRTESLFTANEELKKAHSALWGEMKLAQKIQTVLLPGKPKIEGYEISAYMAPAEEVGGDYYDVISSGGKDWLIIGDVSGHGVSSGLVMMMVQTAIHVTLSNNPDLSPSELLKMINKTISSNIKQMGEDKYMTITVLAAINDGVMHFSGLHQDILIYRAVTKQIESIETNGFWIGIFDDIGEMVRDDSLIIHEGDVMLLYTDGITEAWRKGSIQDERNPEIDMFGLNRLKQVLEASGTSSTDTLITDILHALECFDCQDDVTMLALKRLPQY